MEHTTRLELHSQATRLQGDIQPVPSSSTRACHPLRERAAFQRTWEKEKLWKMELPHTTCLAIPETEDSVLGYFPFARRY